MSALPKGSLVVERHAYLSERGKRGVQWIAQTVDGNGSLRLVAVCDTRREALQKLLAGGFGVTDHEPLNEDLTPDERRWLNTMASWTTVRGENIEAKFDRLLAACDETTECRSRYHLPDCDVAEGAGLGD